jgi:hypothetical protein
VNKLCRVLGWAWHQHVDDGDSVVLVYWQHHQGLDPAWYPSLDDVHHAYGEYNSHNKQGMRNERLGIDKDYGQFYVFDLSHAKCVVRLLCNNSYVRFGEHFLQTN